MLPLEQEQELMPFIHRDISWLYFNYRVLQEAKDPSVPLFERIKFLGIYSSNLDEYFRVRVASLRSLVRLGKKTKSRMDFSPETVLAQIREIVRQHQEEFSAIYQKHILPQLQACNIFVVRNKDLTPFQIAFLDKYYEEKLIQHLQPILIIKNKIRTFLKNGAVYLAVILETGGKTNRYAVVEIPTKQFPRFIQLPTIDASRKEIIILDDIVRHCLKYLFPGYSVKQAFSIKKTRDAELHIEDEYSGDLIDKIRKSVEKRNIGPSTRFVYDRKIESKCLSFLMETLRVRQENLQPEGRYHNNSDFFKFPTFNLRHLKEEPLPPLSHPELASADNLFKVIGKKDRLVHYPYQKYDYMIRLLEHAAQDPKVKEIKVAQYRVAKHSQVVAALRSALQNGKKVVVFVELKARFDEQANLIWAEKFESWGAKVLYSIPELKVHAKLCMITRLENTGPKEYCYLSTGNFNEDTARIYSDFGFFTADERLTEEVKKIFLFLEKGIRPKKQFQHLLVGQFRLRRNLYKLIENEIENAKQGKPASITIKSNSLQDKRIIRRLYAASVVGVKVRLIIRGICCLVPQTEGYSDNIEAISIVDRFLEHVRAYKFHNNGDELIYLSSADLMTRNLYHRIECAFPIYDPDLKQEVNDFLEIQWKDNVKARILDGKESSTYRRPTKDEETWRSQMELYRYYKEKLDASRMKKNKQNFIIEEE